MNNKQMRIFRDQYGQTFHAGTVKELREQLRGSCSRMFRDKLDGSVVHVGYVIGQHWLTEWQQVERAVNGGGND